jgi:sugar O-acyltransferase (sialic acid O-acetyltransferase NeuD family)
LMVSKKQILLVGAGGHARSCIDVIESEDRFLIAGLVGLPEEVNTHILGYPVLGADCDLPQLLGEYGQALITVGQIKSPEPRISLFHFLTESGCALPPIVSPHAHVSAHATLAEGTIVMHGAVVNAGASVGKNCIINSQALVEHDVVIEDHCHISTAAAVNSGVRVGKGTFVGSGSCVRQCVQIGEHCLIGMGQSVLKDCPGGTHLPCQKRVS